MKLYGKISYVFRACCPTCEYEDVEGEALEWVDAVEDGCDHDLVSREFKFADNTLLWRMKPYET